MGDSLSVEVLAHLQCVHSDLNLDHRQAYAALHEERWLLQKREFGLNAAAKSLRALRSSASSLCRPGLCR